MSLTNRISEDLKAAMKSGDTVKLNTIRSIRAQLIELSKRGSDKELSEEEEIGALLAAAKKRKEAMEIYEKAGRKDLFEQEKRELEIISSYLPQQMNREDVEKVIERIIQETDAKGPDSFRKVMPVAMKELKGKFDGKMIQEIVKQKLGG